MNKDPLLPPDLLEEIPSLWGQAQSRHLFPIKGKSMAPFLKEGDIILIEHGINGIKPGDILLFKTGTGLVAHRLIVNPDNQQQTAWLTKGDNHLRYDPPIKTEDILGRAVAIRRSEKEYSLESRSLGRIMRILAAGMRVEAAIYRLSTYLGDSITTFLLEKAAALLLHSLHIFSRLGTYFFLR